MAQLPLQRASFVPASEHRIALCVGFLRRACRLSRRVGTPRRREVRVGAHCGYGPTGHGHPREPTPRHPRGRFRALRRGTPRDGRARDRRGPAPAADGSGPTRGTNRADARATGATQSVDLRPVDAFHRRIISREASGPARTSRTTHPPAVPIPRIRRDHLRWWPLVAVLAAGALLLMWKPAAAPAPTVERVTVVTNSVYDIDVGVAGTGDGGTLSLGTAPARTTTDVKDVIDQGSTWVLHFTAQGEDGGELRIERAALDRAGWRVVIPTAVTERLAGEGLQASRPRRAERTPTRRDEARPRMPPGAPRRGRSASSSSCLPSDAQAACACARCHRRSTSPEHPCASP